MQNIYIQPRLKYYSTFEQLLKSKAEHGDYDFFYDDKFSVKDIFAKKSLFILSEPGYGKTRLLKEIVLRSPEQSKQGIFIDLKKVETDIESFITQKTAIADEINNKFSETKLKTTSFLRTKDFALQNTDATIVCLDALDEIKYEEFSRFADWIKEFSNKYKNIQLIVSCRLHHFKKEQESFIDTRFNFIEIIRFSSEQTHEYLESSGLSRNDIKKIMVLFESAYRTPLIQVPRYLELMIEIIKDKGADYARKLTKTEIFEYFISKKLELEEKKTTIKKKEIIKRVQEKLALIMEIYQSNILSKEELMTFFDDVESNLNISLLQQVPLESFYDRSLLKDNIDTIEFENTEFQEYLAAKEMLRLGRAEQSIFDIAVDQELKEIFPSWFNTLGFAIDLDISLLKPILHFGASRDSIVQDEEYHRLLTTVDTNRLPVKDRKDIFRNIFSYYNKVQHWISYDIARNLSHYFDISQHSLLKESVESKIATYITKTNTASIIEFLIEMNLFGQHEKNYWKSKLIEFIKEKNSVLQRASISALNKFKDIALIKNVMEYLNTDDNLVIQALTEACRQANPNDKFSIDCFVKWTKNDREYIYARYGLWKVKDKKAVKYMLDCFINDPEFLIHFMDHETIFNKHEDDQIIKNIKDIWDKEIQNKLHKIVVSAFSHDQWYVTEKSQFIKWIVGLLGEKDKNYIFKLVAGIKKSNKLKEHTFSLIPIFSLLMRRSHVQKFVNELKRIQEERCALWTLQSTLNDKKNIYEEGRKYFRAEYAETEKQWKSTAKKANKTQNIYREFQLKLPRKGMYHTGIFNFYLSNEEHIKAIMTDNDKKRFKTLIINLIFDKFDPGEQTLTINKREGGSTSYTTHSFIRVFGDCLSVADSLKIDISKYRQRIINYIPFAYGEHRKAIFSLIPNLTAKEINSLLKLYIKKRDDDLQKFMPESFIYASEQYSIVEAVPVLKKFVDEPALLMQDRASALRGISVIQPEEKYFNAIYRKYKDKNDLHQLAEDANKYLIDKFSNKTAIEWRLGQIRKNTFSFIEPKGAHSVSPQESELHDKHFASPILKLKHPRYKEQLLSLLKNSFFIYKKGGNYHAYAQYLWDIVEAFFYNLRETKSYIHLKDLENYIQQHSSEEGMNWFKYKLHRLRVEYMRYIGKPQSIAECIKKYNKLKEKQYLNIATSADLFEVIKRVIDEELRNWVEDEGYYRDIQEAEGKQEQLIQNTIKTQFENYLLKRRLRNKCDIIREHQLLDGKKIDFLISYGFMGPVMIETKRLDNPEVVNSTKRKAYKKKMLQYINGTKSDIGIFLIFRINKKYSLKDYIPKLKEVYKDCDNVEVIELDCIKANK